MPKFKNINISTEDDLRTLKLSMTDKIITIHNDDKETIIIIKSVGDVLVEADGDITLKGKNIIIEGTEVTINGVGKGSAFLPK